jgi:hypothetical protein
MLDGSTTVNSSLPTFTTLVAHAHTSRADDAGDGAVTCPRMRMLAVGARNRCAARPQLRLRRARLRRADSEPRAPPPRRREHRSAPSRSRCALRDLVRHLAAAHAARAMRSPRSRCPRSRCRARTAPVPTRWPASAGAASRFCRPPRRAAWPALGLERAESDGPRSARCRARRTPRSPADGGGVCGGRVGRAASALVDRPCSRRAPRGERQGTRGARRATPRATGRVAAGRRGARRRVWCGPRAAPKDMRHGSCPRCGARLREAARAGSDCCGCAASRDCCWSARPRRRAAAR